MWLFMSAWAFSKSVMPFLCVGQLLLFSCSEAVSLSFQSRNFLVQSLDVGLLGQFDSICAGQSRDRFVGIFLLRCSKSARAFSAAVRFFNSASVKVALSSSCISFTRLRSFSMSALSVSFDILGTHHTAEVFHQIGALPIQGFQSVIRRFQFLQRRIIQCLMMVVTVGLLHILSSFLAA